MFRYKGYLDTVEIVMNNKAGCEKYPHMDMDEHCECWRTVQVAVLQ